MFGRLDGLIAKARRAATSVAAALTFVAVSAMAGQGVASGGVVKVRTGGDQSTTRVVVELDRAASGRLLAGGADPASAVTLALPGVDTGGDSSGRGQGLVKTWSLDEAAGAARLRLELSRPATVKRRFLLPPGDGVTVYRYVLDLEAGAGARPAATSTTAARPAAQTATQTAARSTATAAPTRVAANTAAPARKASETRRASDRRVIVIDPGHGGRDPGASGRSAIEKNITLAAARALKAELERNGRYRVVLTRTSDVYVPLERRVRIAREADADLFISLHADAGGDPSLRGASVYTLSEQGSERAARNVMTRGGDWSMNLPGRDQAVNRILLDLTQRATKNRSATFAATLLRRIDDHAPLLQRSHRHAGFVVLLAPDVPAVLLEMGFITNIEDERLLSDQTRRTRLMRSVASAIDDYFEVEPRYAGFVPQE